MDVSQINKFLCVSTKHIRCALDVRIWSEKGGLMDLKCNLKTFAIFFPNISVLFVEHIAVELVVGK